MLEKLKAQYLRLNTRDREQFRIFVNQDSIFGRIPEAEDDEDGRLADSCIALFLEKLRDESVGLKNGGTDHNSGMIKKKTGKDSIGIIGKEVIASDSDRRL